MSDRLNSFITDKNINCPRCRDPYGGFQVRITTYKDMKNTMHFQCMTCSNTIIFKVGSGHR